ncbi:MAG: hypothetical protein H7X71_00600 [Chitinophagales bacterium]|nr:hypothetical protein [Chitinophagales bacterium]
MEIRITKSKKIFFVFTGLLFLTCSLFYSCFYDNVEELTGDIVCDTASVSYALDIVPILDAFCYECHSIDNADTEGDGFILETYDELTAAVSGEDLIDAVDWLDGSSNMPKDGSKLPFCERALIRNWVNQGELNN